MTKKRVKAREGIEVPIEGAPRRKIGAEPVEVTLTSYYKKQIADGDLVEAP